ncbi:MAG: sodium/proline symporter PutP [Bilifractor sp.]|nr:sodium/proline symporter PutP [Lachnospiraceae bacterium]MDY2836362.1 sodium/proline symporter PutP [Bilifractor sp.]
MTNAQVGILVVMIVYLLGMLAIGFVVAKQNENVSDFYLGGRKLGPLVTAMSAEASDMSSYLLMGLPGVAYLSGMADVGWTCIGLAAGTYLNWLIVAKRIRRYTARTGSITIPDFFSDRYQDKHRVLMMIAACVIIIFFIPYTGSGFAACGKLFSSLFGVDYHIAMIISAAVIISYTLTGGFLAASLTDFIQSIVMTLALIIVLIFGINKAGGMDAVIANAKSLPGYFSMVQTYNQSTGTASPYGFVTIISTLAWGLGYFGMPHILLRFMAIEDDSKLTISRRVASVWVVISMGIAVMIGIVGLGMTKAGAVPLLEGSASETIIVKISSLLSQHGVLAAVFAGIILSGILAATMSTSDSQLLAASSSVSENIIHEFFHLDLDDKKLMTIARFSLAIIAVIGVGIAWNPNSSVFGIVSFAWAGFGATFGPVVLLALFWRRSNKYGALFGMISGGIMVFVWKYAIRPIGGAWNIYELLPAFLVAILVNVIVSLLTPAPEKEITDVFDEMKKRNRGK